MPIVKNNTKVTAPVSRSALLAGVDHADDDLLQAILEHAQARKVNAVAERREKFLDKYTNYALEDGFDSVDALFAFMRRPKNGRAKGTNSATAKYRDPDNPSNIWSGQGRMPAWLAEDVRRAGLERKTCSQDEWDTHLSRFLIAKHESAE